MKENLLPTHGRRPTTIIHQNTIPPLIICIHQRPTHTLIRIHPRKKARFNPPLPQRFKQRLLLRPYPTDAILRTLDIFWLDERFEWRVDIGVPGAGEETSAFA